LDSVHIRFSYYVYDQACRAPSSADDIVFRRWLCACGQGGFTLDSATFRDVVLKHWQSTHRHAPAILVADVQHCSNELIAFVERRVLG
jgi:hypothetical protein